MTDTTAPSPRAIALGERHLAMLAELGDIAMAVSRAYGASAIASAEATDMILKDDYFVPEVGRARACGGRDSAESFQKVTRAVRLTLMMERQTLDWMEGRRSAAPAPRAPDREQSNPPSAWERDGATEANAVRREAERERPDGFDPSDARVHAAFRERVEALCADVGAKPDWERWTIEPPPSLSDDAETVTRGSSP